MSAPEGFRGHDAMQVMPLYFRIFMVLERELRSGHYPPETAMPSEDALARRFDVSRVTIRHTMSLLAERGLVTRLRGKGTFAAPVAPAPRRTGGFDGLNRNIAEFEADSTVTVLSHEPDRLPDWAEADAGADDALRILRVRHDAEGPMSYSICHLVARAAARIDVAALGNRTVSGALEETGLIAARIEQRLTSVAAPHDIAAHLEVAAGGPLTRMRRVMLDDAGRAFEYLEVYYRPDRFEYALSLTRESATAAPSGPPRWIARGR